MNAAKYAEWLEARDEHQRFLFGEQPEMRTDNQTKRSLAAIARSVNLQGTLHYEREWSGSEVADSIAAILAHHDKEARTNGGSAIFGTIGDTEAREHVTSLTTRIVLLWERAWGRDNKKCGMSDATNPSPFAELPVENILPADFEQRDVQLVVEIAAAIGAVLQAGYWRSPSIHSPMASFIAQQGPTFARSWIEGDVIRQYCATHGLNADQWLAWITPRRRIKAALTHPRDPLTYTVDVITRANALDITMLTAAIGSSASQIETEFSMPTRIKLCLDSKDEFPAALALAARLQRTEEIISKVAATKKMKISDVKRIASPRTIRMVIKENTSPDPVLERIISHYQSLSTSNLMQELNITGQQVEQRFPEYVRKWLAWKARGTPDIMGEARSLKAHSAKLMQIGLPPKLALRISMRHPRSYQFVGTLVRQAMLQPPGKVESDEWAYMVADYPHDKDNKRRMERLATYRLWRGIFWPALTDTAAVNRGGLLDKPAEDNSAEAVFLASEPDEVSDNLQALAQKAGISATEIAKLLTYFAENDGQITDAELQTTFAKLKSAAQND